MGNVVKFACQLPGESSPMWLNIATERYADCAYENPGHGQFYHYQAKTTLRDGLSQLFFYCKSLEELHSHVVTVCDVVARRPKLRLYHVFVSLHQALFTEELDSVEKLTTDFITLLDCRLQNESCNWSVEGRLVAICNITAIRQNRPIEKHTLVSAAVCALTLECATRLNFHTSELVTQFDDENILPYIHTFLAFMYFGLDTNSLIFHKTQFPWHALIRLLNALHRRISTTIASEFPLGDNHPLPEDWLLNGLEWTMNYFPDGWFRSENRSENIFLERQSHQSVQAAISETSQHENML